jgi:hypothetical protein
MKEFEVIIDQYRILVTPNKVSKDTELLTDDEIDSIYDRLEDKVTSGVLENSTWLRILPIVIEKSFIKQNNIEEKVKLLIRPTIKEFEQTITDGDYSLAIYSYEKVFLFKKTEDFMDFYNKWLEIYGHTISGGCNHIQMQGAFADENSKYPKAKYSSYISDHFNFPENDTIYFK